MGRVRDNDIRFRNILHHTALGSFTHPLSLAPLDLRISFCVLIFILYFLLVTSYHFEFDFLIDPVCQTNDQIYETDL